MADLLRQLSSLEVILVGVVLLSWVAIALAMASFARVRRQESLIRDGMEELRRSLDISNSGLLGMGRKLLSIEKRFNPNSASPVVGETRSVFQPDAARHQSASRYQQASEMVSQGLSVAQVAAATGMSQAEINLVAMLRQPMARAG